MILFLFALLSHLSRDVLASVNSFNHTEFNVQKRLRTALLQDYDALSVPMKNGCPVNVSVGLNLYRVKNVDINSGVLEIYAWLRMSWKDERLAWDKSVFPVNSMNFIVPSADDPYNEIWAPDLELYTGAEPMEAATAPKAFVSPDGSAYWYCESFNTSHFIIFNLLFSVDHHNINNTYVNSFLGQGLMSFKLFVPFWVLNIIHILPLHVI
jgi:hypothetical protein